MDSFPGQGYHFGTSGWSYRDWQGTVYPGSRDRSFNPLDFLSRHFSFVEVNMSFYRIPTSRLVSGWLRKTHHLPGFGFWLKVHQDITHKRRFDDASIETFLSACGQLAAEGKLRGLLAQFPYSFKLNAPAFEHLKRCRRILSDYPLAVEFRHDSWDQDEILDYFQETELIWVNIDQPLISRSIPFRGRVTHTDTSYVRLHGRNRKAWFSGSGRDARYDYSYSTAELEEIAGRIRRLKQLARLIFVAGNNHYRGQAVQNLKELKGMMGKVGEPSG